MNHGGSALCIYIIKKYRKPYNKSKDSQKNLKTLLMGSWLDNWYRAHPLDLR